MWNLIRDSVLTKNRNQYNIGIKSTPTTNTNTYIRKCFSLRFWPVSNNSWRFYVIYFFFFFLYFCFCICRFVRIFITCLHYMHTAHTHRQTQETTFLSYKFRFFSRIKAAPIPVYCICAHSSWRGWIYAASHERTKKREQNKTNAQEMKTSKKVDFLLARHAKPGWRKQKRLRLIWFALCHLAYACLRLSSDNYSPLGTILCDFRSTNLRLRCSRHMFPFATLPNFSYSFFSVAISDLRKMFEKLPEVQQIRRTMQ